MPHPHLLQILLNDRELQEGHGTPISPPHTHTATPAPTPDHYCSPFPAALQISLHDRKLEEGTPHRVRIARDKSIGELLEDLRRQLPEAGHQGRPLRLMDIYQWKIWQVGGSGRAGGQ